MDGLFSSRGSGRTELPSGTPSQKSQSSSRVTSQQLDRDIASLICEFGEPAFFSALGRAVESLSQREIPMSEIQIWVGSTSLRPRLKVGPSVSPGSISGRNWLKPTAGSLQTPRIERSGTGGLSSLGLDVHKREVRLTIRAIRPAEMAQGDLDDEVF